MLANEVSTLRYIKYSCLPLSSMSLYIIFQIFKGIHFTLREFIKHENFCWMWKVAREIKIKDSVSALRSSESIREEIQTVYYIFWRVVAVSMGFSDSEKKRLLTQYAVTDFVSDMPALEINS